LDVLLAAGAHEAVAGVVVDVQLDLGAGVPEGVEDLADAVDGDAAVLGAEDAEHGAAGQGVDLLGLGGDAAVADDRRANLIGLLGDQPREFSAHAPPDGPDLFALIDAVV